MADIRHRVGTEIPQASVYEAIATVEGLRGWWTQNVEGDAEPGGKLAFSFGGPERSVVMEILELTPANRVSWRCVSGPDEWIGTTFDFDLRSSDGETVLLFTNAGWREPVEFMHHCTTKWGLYILGLKTWLEGADSIAFPNDPHICNWD